MFSYSIITGTSSGAASDNKKKALPPASLKDDTTAAGDDDDDSYDSIRPYELKGYERSFSISPTGCTRMAHIMTVTMMVTLSTDHDVTTMTMTTTTKLQQQQLEQQFRQAFHLVMQQHPKMRARWTKEDPSTSSSSSTSLMCEIVPAKDITEEDVARLVTLQPFSHTHNKNDKAHHDHHNHRRLEEIRAVVEDTCNQTVDRTTQFPYFLTVLYDKEHRDKENGDKEFGDDGGDTEETNKVVTKSSTTYTLLLFSNHALSDATSGMVVLHDLLTHLRTLMMTTTTTTSPPPPPPIKEHPLRPPLYDALRPPPTIWQRGADAMITSFGENFLIPGIANFIPVLPPRSDMQDVDGLPLPHNPSYCYMRVGRRSYQEEEKGNATITTSSSTIGYQAAKAACEQHQVTLTGAITASLVLAYAKLSHATATTTSATTKQTPKFMLSLDLQYDMRQHHERLAQYPETTVGCNIFCAAQEFLSETGLNLTTGASSFWKVAHMADACATSTVTSWNAMAEYIYTHHKFHAKVPDLKLKATKSIISDVSLSHVTYPYPTTLEMSKKKKNDDDNNIDDSNNNRITIESLHIYHSMPNVAYAAVVFVTVINDTFHYTLMSKLSDELSQQLLDHIVKAVESIAERTPEETMVQAAMHLYGEED